MKHDFLVLTRSSNLILYGLIKKKIRAREYVEITDTSPIYMCINKKTRQLSIIYLAETRQSSLMSLNRTKYL